MAATNEEWADLAKRHVKAALARHDVKYGERAKRLTDMGLPLATLVTGGGLGAGLRAVS